MTEFIHVGTLASIIEDAKESANFTFDSGYTVYGEDLLEDAINSALEEKTTYTQEDVLEDSEDEDLETRGEGDLYYLIDDAADACRTAWQYVDYTDTGLTYTEDGKGIATEHSEESWDALNDYGYDLGSFLSLDELLFTAGACFADQKLREVIDEAFYALQSEVESFGV